MAILWKTKQALLNCVAKGSLAHKASLLSGANVLIGEEAVFTFGNPNIEPNPYRRTYNKIAYRATLLERGKVTKVTVYFDSEQSETDDLSAGLYYSDPTQPPWYPPTGLMVNSPSRKVTAGAWNDFVFTTPVIRDAGVYWPFVISSTPDIYLRYIDVGGVSGIVWRADTPPPDDPFGTPDGWGTTRFSIYATYIPV